MKRKLITSLFLMMAFIFGLQAQMIPHVLVYGRVTDISTNLPWAHHDVTIKSDTIASPGFYFFQVIHTNNNGYYSKVVMLPPNATASFIISTLDCNQALNVLTATAVGDSIEANFAVCTSGITPPPPACHAIFTVMASMNNPLEVTFHNLSTGFPAQYFWNFGDGITSTDIYPHHTYAAAGTYTVCMKMVSTSGCSDSVCNPVVVNTPPPPPPCHALFTFHGSFNSTEVHFHNISTGFPATYIWNFGDGDTSSVIDPEHTYALAGTYTVCLVMSNTNGCIDTLCQQVIVNAGTPPPPPPPPPSSMCHNNFKAMHHDLIVNFHSHVWGIGPFTYAWDFGDGDTSSQHNPTHTYVLAGTYTVTLTTTSDSCTYTSTKTITLVAPNLGPFDLNGTVFEANLFVPGAKVILFSHIANMIGLLPIDSTFTDTLGNYQFLQVPAGNYNIEAFPLAGDTTFKPTFFFHSIHLGPAFNPYNIYLRPKHMHHFDFMYSSDDASNTNSTDEKSLNVQSGLIIGQSYPNPARDEMSLIVNLGNSTQVDVSLFNLMGQKSISQSYSLESGNHTLSIGTSMLKTGLYTIKVITSDGTTATGKISIVR